MKAITVVSLSMLLVFLPFIFNQLTADISETTNSQPLTANSNTNLKAAQETENKRVLQASQEYLMDWFSPVITKIVEVVYSLVCSLQILTMLLALFTKSNKVFWIAQCTIQLQLLFLLGAVRTPFSGLMQQLDAVTVQQSVKWFTWGGLIHQQDAFYTIDSTSPYAFLRLANVSPMILNHRVEPVAIYLISTVLSVIPVIGVYFARLRQAALLSFLVHFVFFGTATLVTVSTNQLKVTDDYVWYNFFTAILLLLFVLVDLLAFLVKRDARIEEARNLRKSCFDITKGQIILENRSIGMSLVRNCDLWYAAGVALVYALTADSLKVGPIIIGVLIYLHLSCLLINFASSRATIRNYGYQFIFILRILSQLGFSTLIISKAFYHWRTGPMSSSSSQINNGGFAVLFALIIIDLLLILLLRFTISIESKRTAQYFQPATNKQEFKAARVIQSLQAVEPQERVFDPAVDGKAPPTVFVDKVVIQVSKENHEFDPSEVPAFNIQQSAIVGHQKERVNYQQSHIFKNNARVFGTLTGQDDKGDLRNVVSVENFGVFVDQTPVEQGGR